MTVRLMVLVIVLTVFAKIGFYAYRTFVSRATEFYDEWNGREDPEERRHRECLKHIDEMERDLGLYVYPSFAEARNLRNPDGSFRTPKSRIVGGGGDNVGNSYVETYGVVGQHTSPSGVVTDTYGTTRLPRTRSSDMVLSTFEKNIAGILDRITKIQRQQEKELVYELALRRRINS